MSHFANYVKERYGKNCYETMYGFVSYYYVDNACYIEHVFVDSDFRGKGWAKQLCLDVAMLAKADGANKLVVSVVPSYKETTTIAKMLINNGCKIDSATNDFILFSKEI